MRQRDAAKENYWRRLLGRWRQSGLTGRDFCAEHGVSEPSFYSWRREIARRDQQQATARKRTAPAAAPTMVTPQCGGAFLQLALESSAPPPAIEVVLAQGRLLRVRPGFDAASLHQLLRLLEEPSC
jgi:transposase-like protein